MMSKELFDVHSYYSCLTLLSHPGSHNAVPLLSVQMGVAMSPLSNNSLFLDYKTEIPSQTTLPGASWCPSPQMIPSSPLYQGLFGTSLFTYEMIIQQESIKCSRTVEVEDYSIS